MTDAAGWTAALDALEEWLRLTATALRSRDLQLPAAPAPLPDGVVPASVRLRAQAVLAQLHATEAAGHTRREQLTREHAYQV
jgi:hypothetical protein